ncbi:MAG: thioesterase [Actinobacteria bacterium]|nr:thioesterase [Actinomycetota bacterium]
MPISAKLSYESPYIRRARRPAAKHRLFCLPHAGAGVGAYAGWASLLPPEVEVVVIQLPGREDRINEPAFTEAAALVRSVVQVLRPYLHLPFSFFGHSGGALLGFELTRALSSRYHREPAHLFVSGQAAPDLVDRSPMLHTLPDSKFIEAVYGFGGTARAVVDDPQLMNLVLPALRTDFAVWEQYQFEPGPLLTAPITAFGGDRDERAPVAALEAWRHHTDGEFAVRMFEGNHFFLQDQRTEVARAVGVALQSV